MKITTEPQSIHVEAFGQMHILGAVWLDEKGDICFLPFAAARSELKTFGNGNLWAFINYIRGERDSIRKQLTTFANKVSR
jgi:hypothetical protein